MFALTKQKSEFQKGVIAGISIALGYLPVALTFGFIAETTGLTLIETIGMSAFVYAGAAQYMSLSLLAIGTGAIEIIFTTFIINIRHLLMSTAINEKAEKDHPIIKGLYAFGMTDEVFAVTSTKEGRLTSSYILGVALIAYSSWVVNSGIGYIIGTSLPEMLQKSMSIALYALFIALLVPSLKKHRKIVYLALFAGVLNSFLSMVIPSGWSIIIATLASAVLIEFIYSKKNTYLEEVQRTDDKECG
ncbi:AzlC family ABC transporter permease [Anaerobacillus isosaccharinicus]|uniref:AzlC family ABC transporter permease n=1 Tax=Anaerobacillus isosaccharinicus TaxID=1532552 RepID=A0A1S2LAL0_9BACI|nr:AzlC family ABC transporter permease [Anaerobacillus isosaccharinicus]MBA5587719.1 AzlC family ABC transporter permease [Anaerobacillus isosaccharinicus]QOY34116.1 AzlC family ABC transporter permease [Anaerobacillus isosaccharinicus]